MQVKSDKTSIAGKVMDYLSQELCRPRGYRGLFKGGVVMIGIAMISLSQVGIDLLKIDFSVQDSRFEIEEKAARPIDEVDCKEVQGMISRCRSVQYQSKLMSHVYRIWDNVTSVSVWAGIVLLSLAAIGFICAPLIRRRARDSSGGGGSGALSKVDEKEKAMNDSKPHGSAIALAINASKALRKAEMRSGLEARWGRWTALGMILASIVMVLAFVFVAFQWPLFAVIAAIVSVVTGMVSLIVAVVVGMLPLIRARYHLIEHAQQSQIATGDQVLELWQKLPDWGEWKQAADTLDHASRVAQQWRVFAVGTLAVGLSLYLGTRSNVSACIFQTPLDTLSAMFWDAHLFFDRSNMLCSARGLLGLFLSGALLSVALLQWKISTLMASATLAQRASEFGRSNS